MCIHKFREGQIKCASEGYSAIWAHSEISSQSRTSQTFCLQCSAWFGCVIWEISAIMKPLKHHTPKASSPTHMHYLKRHSISRLCVYFSHPFLSSLFFKVVEDFPFETSCWVETITQWLIVTITQYIIWPESYIYLCFFPVIS